MRIITICNRIIASVEWASYGGIFEFLWGLGPAWCIRPRHRCRACRIRGAASARHLMKPVNEGAPPIVVSFLEQPSSEPAVPGTFESKVGDGTAGVGDCARRGLFRRSQQAADITASAEPPSPPAPVSPTHPGISTGGQSQSRPRCRKWPI